MFAQLSAWFQGRHTMFVVSCMAIGVVLSFLGKLDGNLVTLLLGLQGMILAHSAKESYFQDK